MAAGSQYVTGRDGSVYVPNRNLLVAQDITIERILKYRGNVYGKKVEREQISLVFGEDPLIEVMDKNDNPDEKLQRHLSRMFFGKTVDLKRKMKHAFVDVFWAGIFTMNPVWERQGSEVVLKEIRRLPPETFDRLPPDRDYYSYLLPGITLSKGEKEQVREFWQRQDQVGVSGVPIKLDLANLAWITDPSSTELAGEPIVLPLIPVFSILEYGWNAQMQFLTRMANPPLFIRLNEGWTQKDIDYATEILEYWDKDHGYVIPKHFELIFFNANEPKGTAEIITALEALIIDYCSPASSISKEGTLIGGSSAPEAALYDAYIQGIHRWLEDGFNQLLEYYLAANLYEGYTARVILPMRTADKTAANLEKARLGAEKRTLHPNEVRALQDHEGLDDQGFIEIAKAWDLITPAMVDPFALAPQMPEEEAPQEPDADGAEEEDGEVQSGAGPTDPLYSVLIANAQGTDDPLRKAVAERALSGLDRVCGEFAAEVKSAAGV